MHLNLLLTSAVCGAKIDDDARIFMVTISTTVFAIITVAIVENRLILPSYSSINTR